MKIELEIEGPAEPIARREIVDAMAHQLLEELRSRHSRGKPPADLVQRVTEQHAALEVLLGTCAGARRAVVPDDDTVDAAVEAIESLDVAVTWELGAILRSRVDAIAAAAVSAQFEAEIKRRITEAVDTALREGWVQTDAWGSPRGTRTDLKGRISDALMKGESGQRPLITELVTSTTRDFLSREFQREVDAARDKLREQLDAQVVGAFAATLKSALGLR